MVFQRRDVHPVPSRTDTANRKRLRTVSRSRTETEATLQTPPFFFFFLETKSANYAAIPSGHIPSNWLIELQEQSRPISLLQHECNAHCFY